MLNNTTFLDIKNLSKGFNQQSGILTSSKFKTKAVDEVSFQIFERESFGLVGETGSGKSTLGRCLLRLTEPDQGQVFHKTVNLIGLSIKNLLPYRKKFQMIFQNPGQSLNPIHTVGRALAEPLEALNIVPLAEIPERTKRLLADVGLKDRILNYFPHQLSGGQKQRVVIARALAVRPTFIIADEPTSSVDASIKRQVLDLIKDLRTQFGLTILLITHDLSVISYATDRTAVMYKGRLVEIAPTIALMEQPGHPYTRQLVDSYRLTIKKALNESSTYMNDPSYHGCEFANSCPYVKSVCKSKNPELRQSINDRFVACYFPDKLLDIK